MYNNTCGQLMKVTTAIVCDNFIFDIVTFLASTKPERLEVVKWHKKRWKLLMSQSHHKEVWLLAKCWLHHPTGIMDGKSITDASAFF